MAHASLPALLDELAAATPTPGAGSAAGWAAALAAGLTEMAGGLTRQQSSAVLVASAQRLRAEALHLAERDRSSYAGVLEAKRNGGDVERALAAAADVPMELARVATEVAELAAVLAATGNPALEGDATAAALLAEAASRSAARLVELNLADVPADERHARAIGLADRAGAAREAVLRRDGR